MDLRTFLVEVREELSRVTWPSPREIRATTIVVIVFSVAMALYTWGLDLLLDRLAIWLWRSFSR